MVDKKRKKKKGTDKSATEQSPQQGSNEGNLAAAVGGLRLDVSAGAAGAAAAGLSSPDESGASALLSGTTSPESSMSVTSPRSSVTSPRLSVTSPRPSILSPSDKAVNPRDKVFIDENFVERDRNKKSDVAPDVKSVKNVLANHFKVTFEDTNLKIIKYSVDMKINNRDGEKECPKALKGAAMKEFCKQYITGCSPAFDGENQLFCKETQSLKVNPDEKIVTLTEDGSSIQVTVQVTKTESDPLCLQDISTYAQTDTKGTEGCRKAPQAALQALEVVLRQAGTNNAEFMRVGRSFFDTTRDPAIVPTPEKDPKKIEKQIEEQIRKRKIEIRIGAFQGSSLGESEKIKIPFYLNVDVSCKAFPLHTMNVVELKKQKFPNKEDEAAFLNYLKHVKVIYTPPFKNGKKRYVRITAIAEKPRDERFKIDKDKMISVEQYFKDKYGVRNIGNDYPCLQTGSGDKINCFPMQYCYLAPLKYQTPFKKVDSRVVDDMIKVVSGLEVATRQSEIDKIVESLKLNDDSCVKDFGIKVGKEMTKVNGKVLPKPKLRYIKNEKQVKVDVEVQTEGKWSIADDHRMTYLSFNKAEIASIKVVCIKHPNIYDKNATLVNAEVLKHKLYDRAQKHGMNLKQTDYDSVLLEPTDNKLDLGSKLQEQLVDKKERVVYLVLIPEKPIGNENPYTIVKEILEKKNGRLTQCFKISKAFPVDGYKNQMYSNIILKINAKLGGKSHVLAGGFLPKTFFVEGVNDFMIMGADVTHPSPGSKGPSIAAVTASYTEDLSSYNMNWRVQPPKKEKITDLQEMTRAHFDFHKKSNGTKSDPKKVIFFRDGVSDTMFAEVLLEELTAIKKAFKSHAVGKGKKRPELKVTYIVVQKRNHTRFFDPNKTNTLRKCNAIPNEECCNVEPGFTVDSTITHPWQRDFFLVSQYSKKGTVRPTRYRVLHDENNLKDHEIEQLAFDLCHVYTRCNKSVSYPAPTYYAHLAAARARHFYGNVSIPDDPNQSDTEKEAAWIAKVGEVNGNKGANVDLPDDLKKHPMFFV